jgi:hypothetical protein
VDKLVIESGREYILILIRAFTLLADCSNQPHTRESARMHAAPPPMRHERDQVAVLGCAKSHGEYTSTCSTGSEANADIGVQFG